MVLITETNSVKKKIIILMIIYILFYLFSFLLISLFQFILLYTIKFYINFYLIHFFFFIWFISKQTTTNKKWWRNELRGSFFFMIQKLFWYIFFQSIYNVFSFKLFIFIFSPSYNIVLFSSLSSTFFFSFIKIDKYHILLFNMWKFFVHSFILWRVRVCSALHMDELKGNHFDFLKRWNWNDTQKAVYEERHGGRTLSHSHKQTNPLRKKKEIKPPKSHMFPPPPITNFKEPSFINITSYSGKNLEREFHH